MQKEKESKRWQNALQLASHLRFVLSVADLLSAPKSAICCTLTSTNSVDSPLQEGGSPVTIFLRGVLCSYFSAQKLIHIITAEKRRVK